MARRKFAYGDGGGTAVSVESAAIAVGEDTLATTLTSTTANQLGPISIVKGKARADATATSDGGLPADTAAYTGGDVLGAHKSVSHTFTFGTTHSFGDSTYSNTTSDTFVFGIGYDPYWDAGPAIA